MHSVYDAKPRGLRKLFVTLIAVSLAAIVQTADASSDTDHADIARVEAYLNGIHSMQSRFLQIAPDGSYASGRIFLSRPGKLRVEYDPPDQLLLITTDIWLIFYDPELEQVSYLPLGTTPAEFLIRESIKLGDEIVVLDVERGPGALRITLADSTDLGAGKLTLIFSDEPLALRKWEVVDAEDEVTNVALIDPIFDIPIDPDLFKFVDPSPDRSKDR